MRFGNGQTIDKIRVPSRGTFRQRYEVVAVGGSGEQQAWIGSARCVIDRFQHPALIVADGQHRIDGKSQPRRNDVNLHLLRLCRAEAKDVNVTWLCQSTIHDQRQRDCLRRFDVVIRFRFKVLCRVADRHHQPVGTSRQHNFVGRFGCTGRNGVRCRIAIGEVPASQSDGRLRAALQTRRKCVVEVRTIGNRQAVNVFGTARQIEVVELQRERTACRTAVNQQRIEPSMVVADRDDSSFRIHQPQRRVTRRSDRSGGNSTNNLLSRFQ